MINAHTNKNKLCCDDVAQNLARHLLANQVVAKDFLLDFSQVRELFFEFKLLNKSSENIQLHVKLLKDGQFLVNSNKTKIKVPLGQFWRITSNGNLSTVAGFKGLKPSHKGIRSFNDKKVTIQKINPVKVALVASLKKLPKVLALIKICRDYLFPEPQTDLALSEGVTFRFSSSALQNYIFTCDSYDEGGIYDEYVNAEGITYPNQVAGNYYADAYSCLVFEQMYKESLNEKWLEASLASQRFTQRVYPQYMPASIVWHHSDFKNAAIIESQVSSKLVPTFLKTWEFTQFFEDRYEPTNVFALRYHWKSALAELEGNSDFVKNAKQDLAKVAEDQTLDGLFHDNIDTYPDAHDLTYHQYSTACLGMGLLHSEDPDGWDIFNRAVRFSLQCMSPDGEPAYTGRASNNIHQSASAILAFTIAASRTTASDERDILLRGVYAMIKRLKSFQLESGMLPTAMNEYVEERVAWNHCETPYNALVGYMLIRASSILQTLPKINEEVSLPLEKEHLWVANDAGFASIGNNSTYLVCFAGCDRSYGWSEDRHVTGCAGIALFGEVGGRSLLPCLDVSIPNEIVISDMPLINHRAAFGRGNLAQKGSSIKYSHSFAGARVNRQYSIINGDLIIVGHIKAVGKPVHVQGAMAWPALHQDGVEMNIDRTNNMVNILVSGSDKWNLKVWHIGSNNFGEITQSQLVSNAKGKASRFDFGQGIVEDQLTSVLVLSKKDNILDYQVLANSQSVQLTTNEVNVCIQL